MSSRWNENLIIFAMALGSTCSDGHIKIRIFGAHQESTPSQTWPKLPKLRNHRQHPWCIFCHPSVDTTGSRHLVLQWPRNHEYSVLLGNDFLILLPEYGFGVQVQFQEGVRHLKPPNLRFGIHSLCLMFNPIKGISNIISILTHTLAYI